MPASNACLRSLPGCLRNRSRGGCANLRARPPTTQNQYTIGPGRRSRSSARPNTMPNTSEHNAEHNLNRYLTPLRHRRLHLALRTRMKRWRARRRQRYDYYDNYHDYYYYYYYHCIMIAVGIEGCPSHITNLSFEGCPKGSGVSGAQKCHF